MSSSLALLSSEAGTAAAEAAAAWASGTGAAAAAGAAPGPGAAAEAGILTGTKTEQSSEWRLDSFAFFLAFLTLLDRKRWRT